MSDAAPDPGRHLTEALIPFWRDHGVHPEGGFWNRLHADGRPVVDPERRLLAQTRQLYVMAVGARLGVAGAEPLARAAFAHVEESWRDRVHDGYFHTRTADGAPADRRKDFYGHAFVVFAYAHYASACGDGAALERAHAVVALLERHLADPSGAGLYDAGDEDWTPHLAPRRQNPHMHWLEALLALEAASPGSDAGRSARLVDLLRERFLDPESGLLREHFDTDWCPASGSQGRVVEPGHHFEWSWLLRRYASQLGDTRVVAEADALHEAAWRLGTDGAGGVFDELDTSGAVVRDSQRLWPQTELVKSLAARGEPEALRAALVRLLARDTQGDGRFVEHLDATGAPLHEYLHGTSVYHVTFALQEAQAALAAA